MVETVDIDVTFDFRSDSAGRDPDSASPTLKRYHQALWSKPLPNGEYLHLTTDNCSYLRYKDMYFGSDSITASFRYERNKELLRQVEQIIPSPSEYFENYEHKAYTIGGEIIFPKHQGSINQTRGCSKKICDRWDLTLECIRRYYAGEPSPLDAALQRDKDFFELFKDFKGYVDFFLLQDCVNEKYQVKLWLDTPLFENDPMPKTTEDYFSWINSQLDFVKKRSKRITDYWMRNEKSEIELGEDELTTEMHYELLKDEVSHFDLMVYAASGAISGGMSKENACKKYNITVEEYDSNIDRVLNDPSW